MSIIECVIISSVHILWTPYTTCCKSIVIRVGNIPVPSISSRPLLVTILTIDCVTGLAELDILVVAGALMIGV